MRVRMAVHPHQHRDHCQHMLCYHRNPLHISSRVQEIDKLAAFRTYTEALRIDTSQ